MRRSRRTLYENPWLRFEAHEIDHPNGRPGEHGLVINPEAAGVIAVDGDDVVLAWQPRFAIDARILEIVKGGASPGESWLEAAQRELREELGLTAARWDELGITHEIPSIVQMPIHLYLARELTDVGSDPEDVESIDVHRMPLREALADAAAGAINDAVTVVALFRAAHVLGRDGR